MWQFVNFANYNSMNNNEEENEQFNDFERTPTPDEWGFWGFVLFRNRGGVSVENAIKEYKKLNGDNENNNSALRHRFFRLRALRKQYKQNKRQ
jgi:hypothetical protein